MSERFTNLNSIHERLASARGAEYWRCLEELADTEEVRELLQREYPRQASAWDDSVDCRGFLKLMGASLAASWSRATGAGPQRSKAIHSIRRALALPMFSCRLQYWISMIRIARR